MHSLPEYLVDYLNEIAKDEGFVEHSLHFESGSNHGDGFIAAMVAVTIKGKRMADYENEAEVSLMCKLLPDNKARREFFKSTLLFEREVCVYKELLPMFSKFQLERNISMDDGFFEYPKCYLAVADATKNHYVIIMENVKVCGYELWDKRKPVDFHTSSIFLKTLGRFHGLSLALRDQEPELFQKLIALKDIMNAMMDSPDLVNFVKDAIEKAIGILIKEDEVNLLRYINDNYIHLIRTLFATNGGSGAVLIHGDCWNNNFCFLSDTNKKPTKIRLFDWQVTAMASPALDLSYYLLTSTTKELRVYYDDLLKVYHDSLSELLTKLGSDPHKLFPFNELENQLKQFGIYGVIMTPILLQVIVSDPQNIIDMDTIDENTKNIEFATFDDSSIINYRKRVSDSIQDAVKFGWIDL